MDQKPILVVGGGISGVTAAVELAEAGREVILVEKEPFLGGNVVKFNNYFPKLCPPICGMEINFRRIRNNGRVRVLTSTEVSRLQEEKDGFAVTLSSAPQLITDMCTNCGDCLDVCPVERPDAFNGGMGTTKAVYRDHALAFPGKVTIDAEYCEGVSCGKCADACAYDAIKLTAEPVEETVEVHAVIPALGWKAYDPAKLEALSYEGNPDVVTNIEFERILSGTGPTGGKLQRLSDGKPVKSVAFVQCAGSRDRNHLPYCSAVCCSASLKHALNVTESSRDTMATIFYIDLRVTGRNEDFLERVKENSRVELIKGKVAGVKVLENGQVGVEAENIAEGVKKVRPYDMVVLATGIVPEAGIPGMVRNSDGFVSAADDSGIFPAGCSKKPMDVTTSVKDATAAAVSALFKTVKS